MSEQQKILDEYCALVEASGDLKSEEALVLYGRLSPDNKELVDALARMAQHWASIENDAKESAAEVREQIAPGGQLPAEQMWIPCAPMPTDMCRVSPFFPLRQRDMAERPFIKDMVITASSWGEIQYTGPKLSTYEEDVLLALLALLDSAKNQVADQVKGETTYTYRGPLLPVLRHMGYGGTSYGGADYERVLSALRLMMSSVIEMRVYGRTSRGKKKAKRIIMNNLLSHADWDADKKELTVTINPYFYEQYIQGTVTLIDVLERARIKSPIAKALMRFMKSHRDDTWGPGHYLTVGKALNLDLEQPAFQIRRLLKGAMKELVGLGLLTEGEFVSTDLVKITRRPRNAKHKQLAAT